MKIDRFRLILFTALSSFLAAFDYVVRVSSAAWTEVAVAQIAVSLSPLVYLFLFTLLALELRAYPARLSEFGVRIAAVFLCAYSVAVILQVFLRSRGVGSATYSEVLPLFLSGIPSAVLTFIVFFRVSRDRMSSGIVATITIVWLVMPIGIDALYVTQGGYRGPGELSGFTVIGTIYSFIQWVAAIGLFFSFIGALVCPPVAFYLLIRSNGWERLYILSMALSIFSLLAQFWNWGGFVWD